MNFTTTTMSIILAGCMLCALPATSTASSKSKAKVSAPVILSGQIFVVTKGRDNIKLALVEVAAIPEDEMLAHLKNKHGPAIEQQSQLKSKLVAADDEFRYAVMEEIMYGIRSNIGHTEFPFKTNSLEEARAAIVEKQSACKKIKSEFTYFGSPAIYMEGIPTPASISKTDADGKFTLTIPSGKKYIIAAATNRTVFKDTEQYYWLVRIDASSPVQALMLSNDNQVETKCKECILLQEGIDMPVNNRGGEPVPMCENVT